MCLLASQSENTNQNDGTLKHDRKYYLLFEPHIASMGRDSSPCAIRNISVRYYYIDTIYKDTPSGKIIIYSGNKTVKDIELTDGMFYNPGGSDPAIEALRLERNYIIEHKNHFLEEVYEKIPETRNADEIMYMDDFTPLEKLIH